MRKPRIADRVAHYLIAEGCKSVIWGDGILCEAAYDHDPGAKRHPLDRIEAALASCERATDLFEKKRVLAHDSRVRQRLVRSFWLIGTPRPLPSKSGPSHDK